MHQQLDDDLSRLHDAVVEKIVHHVASDGRRTVSLTVVCDSEAGHDSWDGRRLEIVADDVWLFRLTAFGSSTAVETIDGWAAGVGDRARADMRRMSGSDPEAAGIPLIELNAWFHSGPTLELVCARFSIGVVPSA